MFVHLAHVLDPNDVAWPGEPVFSIEQDTHLSAEGKPFNSHLLTLPNRFGTHMDGPRHFNTTGVPFDELSMEKFGYLGEEIFLVDLPHRNGPDEIVTKEDLEPYAEQLAGKRLLLIRTGFEEKRTSDPLHVPEQRRCPALGAVPLALGRVPCPRLHRHGLDVDSGTHE